MSVIEKAASAFTDTSLPKFTRDPLVYAGTSFCYDYTSAQENLNPDGALLTGSLFGNLVDGGLSSRIAGTTNNIQNIAGKKGLLLPQVTTGSYVTMGVANGDFDRSLTNHEFLSIIWFMVTAYSSNKAIYYNGPGGSRTGHQLYIDQGSVGGVAATVAGKTVVAAGGTLLLNQANQVAVHWVPGASLRLFANNAIVASTQTTVPAMVNSGASYTSKFTDNAGPNQVYRSLDEDLFATRAADPLGDGLVADLAAARVAADYAFYRARLTALGIA